MKKAKIYLLSTAVLLSLSTALSAAEPENITADSYSFKNNLKEELPNFLHPRFSDLACVFRTQNLSNDTHRVGTMSIIMASLNKGGAFELNGGYYLTRNMLYGLDAAIRPIEDFTVRVGIQKLPYILEANANLATHPFFGFSQQVSYLGGYSDLTGLSTRGKDFGISVEGSLFKQNGYHSISYIAGIYNGSGVKFKDDDNKKDFAGRIVFQPSKELKFSVGAIVGYYTPMEEADTTTPSDNLPDVSEEIETPENHKTGPLTKKRYSAGIHYDSNGWFFKAEDVFGITDNLRSNGISTYGGKILNESNTVAVKFDHFRKDVDLSESGSTKMGAGLSHNFGGGVTTKIQYDHTSYSNPNLSSVNSVSVCLMISFSTQL